MSNFSTEVNDPRYFQIFYLGTFLFYGLNWLGWSADLNNYLVIIGVATVTQLLFSFLTNKRYSSVKSGLITALGLCLLLKTGNLWVAALASFVAIASKFLIKHKTKHIFNPANIGIIGAIVLSGNAWVSPGQWGSGTLMWFFIGSAGLMMILKVGRLDTTFYFLLAFAILSFTRDVVYLDWEPAVWFHKMSNGTLLLFSFFMITDPMTTPNHKAGRAIWAIGLAFLVFTLSNFLYVQTAVIWVLFGVSFVTPVIDYFYKEKKFEWFDKTLLNKHLPI